MARELTRALQALAERGNQRGSDQVLEGARLTQLAPPSGRWQSFRVALAAGAIALIVIGVVLWADPFGAVKAPVVTDPPSPPTTVVDDAGLQSFQLIPDPDVDPVRVVAVIGELEFTNYQLPETPVSPPAAFEITGATVQGPEFFAIAATPYGVVATELERDILWWSADGVTWQGGISVTGQDITVVGHELVLGSGVLGRYVWDGAVWAEASRIDLPDGSDRMTYGPQGAIAVVEDMKLYYSADGTRSTPSSAGPTREGLPFEETRPFSDRYTSAVGGCDVNTATSIPMLRTLFATDEGFVAVTPARPEDWHYWPSCNPLLWFSANMWESSRLHREIKASSASEEDSSVMPP